ncbi:MAG: hypothetical protein AB7F09_00080 [Parvibaculaceae bacterium]
MSPGAIAFGGGTIAHGATTSSPQRCAVNHSKLFLVPLALDLRHVRDR